MRVRLSRRILRAMDVPVIDRATDEGQFTRFQVYASEHERVRYTPKFTVQLER